MPQLDGSILAGKFNAVPSVAWNQTMASMKYVFSRFVTMTAVKLCACVKTS